VRLTPFSRAALIRLTRPRRGPRVPMGPRAWADRSLVNNSGDPGGRLPYAGHARRLRGLPGRRDRPV